jgi:hypothetical protein
MPALYPPKGFVGTLYPYGGFTIGYSAGENKRNKENRIKKHKKEIQSRKDYENIYDVIGFNQDDYPDSIIDYVFSESTRKIATKEQLEASFDAYYRLFHEDLEREWSKIAFDWATRFPDGLSPDYSCNDDYPHQYNCSGETSKTALPSMGLSKVTIPRTRKGLKGISKKGTHSVKSGCFLMERAYKGRLGLATITLPPMSEFDRRTLHDNFGDFTNRLYECIRRELKLHGCNADDVVSVTEIQSERLKEYDELYLHLHFVYVCRSTNRRNDNRWFLTKERLPEMVSQQVENCLNRAYEGMDIDYRFDKDSVNWGSSCRVELIKKSCVGYLGKYLSKGARTIASIDEKHKQSFPYQWWYVSSLLKEAIKAGTYRLSVGVCNALIDKLAWMQLEGLLLYVGVGDIPINDAIRLVCISGLLSFRGIRYVLGIVENCRNDGIVRSIRGKVEVSVYSKVSLRRGKGCDLDYFLFS